MHHWMIHHLIVAVALVAVGVAIAETSKHDGGQIAPSPWVARVPHGSAP